MGSNECGNEMLKLIKVVRFIIMICFITRYTSKSVGANDTVYAIVLDWPISNHLVLGAPVSSAKTTVEMLGYAQPLKWEPIPTAGLNITMPNLNVKQLPCKWAWVLRFSNVK